MIFKSCLKTQREYAPGTTVLISDLRCPESYGAFEPKVFRLLRSSGEADEARICIASVFSAQQDGGLPIESLANRSLAVQPRKDIAKRFLDWHRNNVYLGTETAKTA